MASLDNLLGLGGACCCDGEIEVLNSIVDEGPMEDICWPLPLPGSFCFSNCVVMASTSARVESS